MRLVLSLSQTKSKDLKLYSNEELDELEKQEMDGKAAVPGSGDKSASPVGAEQALAERIKTENPELSKVLSEEPSATVSTGEYGLPDHD